MPWLLSLLLLSALADDPRFVDATSRMKKLDYEGALAVFDKLVAEPRPDAEHEELLLWSGAARALLGDDGGARLAFDAALRIDPEAHIDFKTSPKVVELFDAVRAAQPPPSPSPSPSPLAPGTSSSPPPPSSSPSRASPSRASPSRASPSRVSPADVVAAPPHARAVAANAQPEKPERGPGLAGLVGVGAGVVAAGCAIASVAFALDVSSRMQVASDPSTAQLDAKNLVDGANASLAAASVFGATAVAGAAVGVASFVWLE